MQILYTNPSAWSIRLMLKLIAVLLRKTVASMAMPCSVKAYGSLHRSPQLDVAFCDIKFDISLLVTY